MNEFNQTIEAARRQQNLIMLRLIGGFVIILFIVITIVFSSRGTLLKVLPEEIASHAQINVEDGVAMVIYGHLYSLSSSAVIRVQAPDFITAKKIIPQEDFGKITTINLIPLPGELKLTSTADEKTSWYVNNKIEAIADVFEKVLDAGEYSLRISHPYFEPQTRIYTVGRGEAIAEHIELIPIEGQLEVKSSPKAATVIVDGINKGQTPLLLPLSAGIHDIEITKLGFSPTLDRVEIKNSAKEAHRSYRLSPQSAGVTLTLSPSGGVLTLNNLTAQMKGRLNVSSGKKNTLTYTKPGYFSQSKTFTLKPDEVRSIVFSLEKEFGSVEITSRPKATVTINGQKAGVTPLTASLNAIAQDIELSFPGYRSVRKRVIPSSKSPAKFSATLIPEAKARLMEAPKSYKTRAGGEMVLFKPNDRVIMGALRGEPGQRANEFIKTAELTKPFYAGRHEVSNAAYIQFKPNHSGAPNSPVTSVSWLDAIRYANWLSQIEGLNLVYEVKGNDILNVNISADGYRLLTEAEWEWLARKAGRKKQTQFVWGDDKIIPRKAANIADESTKGTVNVYVPHYDDGQAGVASVMSMQREQSGLFDMGGNVSEWTHDSYNLDLPKKGAIYSHSLDPKTSGMRVVKGANWRSGSLTELRASYREGLRKARDDLGFRLGRFVYGGS